MGTDNSTARGRELGAELRQRREKAGYYGNDMARKLGWSPSKVSRLETGARRGASEIDVAVYLATCGVPRDELNALVDLHVKQDDGYWIQPHREQLPGELRSLVIQETTASTISNYEPLVVPGLLQTEDYACALFREVGRFAGEGIDVRVQARLDRQEILRRDRPPGFAFFVHEQALRLPVGGMRIMHEQMRHLLFVCSRSRCAVRVVPVSAGARTGVAGPFVMMEYAEHKPVVCVENDVASLFLEQREDVDMYRAILRKLAGVALDEGQSRERLAWLASEYDRAEENHDAHTRAGSSDVAEEQLQRWG